MMKQCGLVQAISVTKRERQQTRPQVVVCPVPNRSSTDWRSARFLLERTKTASAELLCTTSVPDPACAVRHIEVCVMSGHDLSLIHISEPTRRTPISYAVFCLKKK